MPLIYGHEDQKNQWECKHSQEHVCSVFRMDCPAPREAKHKSCASARHHEWLVTKITGLKATLASPHAPLPLLLHSSRPINRLWLTLPKEESNNTFISFSKKVKICRMKNEDGFAEDKEELPKAHRGDHSSQPIITWGGMAHTWECQLTLPWVPSKGLPHIFLIRTNPHQHPLLNSWKEWVNGSQKSIKGCQDGRPILEWLSVFFLPAILSYLLREQKLWYLILA